MPNIKIALVGRPNVGKSALFNRMLGKRLAIIEASEGVTRDRLYGVGDLFGAPFELIDTGGIGQHLPYAQEVLHQTQMAIEEANCLIMVVDGQGPVTTLDEQVAKLLRATQKPICLAINKIDTPSLPGATAPFYGLGIASMVEVSATHGYQIEELLGLALSQNRSSQSLDQEPSGGGNRLNVAVVGRPNVGKSTLINALTDQERCLVSSLVGTTRDAVDIPFTTQGGNYLLIDTAGIRKKSKETALVEKFATIRTTQAIERADLCLLLLDATCGLHLQDKKIAKQVEQAGKGLILLINKWDAVDPGVKMEHLLRSCVQNAPFLTHCPRLCLSAKTGRNLDKLFPVIDTTAQALSCRITTGELNSFLEQVIHRNPPPMIKGRRLRIYYMTQIANSPPRFVLFVNHPHLMLPHYKRYLINQFRASYPFQGAPLQFYLRAKKSRPLHRRDGPRKPSGHFSKEARS